MIFIGLSMNAQSYYDNFLDHELKREVLLTQSDGLDVPMDMDFVKRSGRENELWVLNQSGWDGGTFTIISDVTDIAFQIVTLYDSHNGHFMIFSTAVAMGDNGNFATTQYIKNTAGEESSTFMGPSLFTVGVDTFGVINQSNWDSDKPLGSHMDMLHQSPFSTGVAFEKGNAYWINDGWNGNVIRYDFVDDHGPGGEYHGDGILSRYPEVETQRVDDIVSHMILDEDRKWLYIVDTGNKRVLRLDITSGNRGNDLFAPNEELADYYEVVDASFEVIIDAGLEQPAGIELTDDRLFISDYAQGKIFIYDITDNFALKGTIDTETGIQGIVIGPDKSLYYANSENEEVIRLSPIFLASVDELDISDFDIDMSIEGIVNIRSKEQINMIELMDVSGRKLIEVSGLNQDQYQLQFNNFESGIYFVRINGLITKKVQFVKS
jgi:sugar lactone lactonase YvrE